LNYLCQYLLFSLCQNMIQSKFRRPLIQNNMQPRIHKCSDQVMWVQRYSCQTFHSCLFLFGHTKYHPMHMWHIIHIQSPYVTPHQIHSTAPLCNSVFKFILYCHCLICALVYFHTANIDIHFFRDLLLSRIVVSLCETAGNICSTVYRLVYLLVYSRRHAIMYSNQLKSLQIEGVLKLTEIASNHIKSW